MDLLRRHWAVLASTAAHGAILGALLLRFDSLPPLPGVLAELEMQQAALEAVEASQTSPDLVTAAPPPAPLSESESLPETKVVEAPPDQKPDETPPVEKPLDAKPEQVQMAQPDQLEPLKEMVAATLEAPPPVLQSTATDAPVDVAEAPPEPPKARPPRPRAKPAAAAPQTPPAPLAPRAAIASPAVAAGPPPDYLASLRARLERAKIYPREAQMRGAQGVAHLQFVLDRSGRLLSFSIVRSSGHEALDREVEAMIHRAAPFPPLPVELASEKLAVLVPIEFSLR